MIQISVTIITYNEQRNILRCLDSIKTIADEIVIVDSFSTDETKAICHKFKEAHPNIPVKFIEQKFLGHIEQKNFAQNHGIHPWILHLDADEALGSELLQSLKKLKQEGAGDSVAFGFPRLTNYCGQWIKHCGWYPDVKVRLWKKGMAHWGGKNPHDIIILPSGMSFKMLQGDLLHYSYYSVAEHINQTNKFTTIAAKVAFEDGVRSGLLKTVTRPILKFLRDYIWKLGFLDGRYGLIICKINALSAFLKYSKIWELQKGQNL